MFCIAIDPLVMLVMQVTTEVTVWNIEEVRGTGDIEAFRSNIQAGIEIVMRSTAGVIDFDRWCSRNSAAVLCDA